MTKEKQTALVVGGTSGLGLELALLLAQTHDVTVTGRHNPHRPGLEFRHLDLRPMDLDITPLAGALDDLIETLPDIDVLVHAAAFKEDSKVDGFSNQDVLDTLGVSLITPMMLLPSILRTQNWLAGFIAITSTSQIKPQPYEANYCAAKAGLAMYAQCVALDPRVGKTLVAAPTGMQTRMQAGRPDYSKLLHPRVVAEEIMRLYNGMNQKFEAHLILRNPLQTVPFMEAPPKK